MGIREDRLAQLARATTMPHRKEAAEESHDARLESTIGRFHFAGLITQSEFDAGVRYGQIVLNYLKSIDAPKPYGDGFNDMSDDACFQRKIMCTQSRQILKDAANAARVPQSQVITACDRLTVYGESPRSDQEMKALRIGLRALAHGSNIIPFRR